MEEKKQEELAGGTKKKSGKSNIIKLVVILAVVVAVTFLLKHLGVADFISLENLVRLKSWIEGFGILGPIVFIGVFIAGAVFFLPGLPLGLLSGIAFGPVQGALYASIGGTLGATAAFLIARYAARDMVAQWVEKNKQLQKLEEGVRQNGWRMLMITRLVPIFPYNLQNYAYGLTSISLLTYMPLSFVFMLPGSIAFTFVGGSLTVGGDLRTVFTYLSIAAVCFVLLSLIPGWIKKKHSKSLNL